MRNRKPGRKLSVVPIKRLVLFLSNSVLGGVSLAAGVGVQPALSPMLRWMFGYNILRSSGLGFVGAVAGGLGWILSMAFRQAVSLALLGKGSLLFVGATIGALLASILLKKAALPKRLTATLGTMLCVYTLLAASSISEFYPHGKFSSFELNVLVSGLSAGVLARLLQLPGGLLMVPACFWLSRYGAHLSIASSVLGTSLAAFLPAYSCLKKQERNEYETVILLSGITAGIVAEQLCRALGERALLIYAMVVALFFTAREMADAVISPSRSESLER